MRILYIGYWPAEDGLTQSVILPRLEILSGLQYVEEIVFCSVERGDSKPLRFNLPKVTQLFFGSVNKYSLLLTKLSDFRRLYLMMRGCVNQRGTSLIICNSPLAGIIGYHLSKSAKIPFVVECFEPHALYMLEAGAWKFWDPRFLTLSFYEWQQKRTAFKLATVSSAYTAKLVSEGVPEGKIATVPNCISLEKFVFKIESRSVRRLELGIRETDVVGIYVGKFGDIYYDEEAFDLFAEAFGFFGDRFWLIVLTAANPLTVIEKLKRRRIPETRIRVSLVAREKVPDYLSASDFAFSTIRPSRSRLYCCPIKNGEYWANGLPVLLEDGIGEDSAIVRNEGGGILLNPGQSQIAFKQLSELMNNGRAACAAEIIPIAIKHRRMEILSDYYRQLFDQVRL